MTALQKKKLHVSILTLLFSFILVQPISAIENTYEKSYKATEQAYQGQRTIKEIYVIGNKYISEEAILNAIPYKKGGYFDPIYSNKSIYGLYLLGYFKNIEIKGQNIDDNKISLFVIVEEKKRLKETIIKGNTQVKTKEIYKKIPFDEIKAIDETEVKKNSNI